MLLRSTSQRQAEHWSKDFVEHLRTVHLALVTVSVGIILLLSSATYDPRRSASQMSEVVRMSSSWPTGISEQQGDEIISWSSANSVDFHPWFHAEYGPSHNVLAFHVEEPNLFLCGPEGHEPPDGYWNMAGLKPITLDDFTFLWNLLAMGPLPADSIISVASVGAMSKPTGGVDETIKIRTDLAFEPETNPVLLHLVEYPCGFNRAQGPSLIGHTTERGTIRFRVVAVKRGSLSQYTDHGRLVIRPVNESSGWEGRPFNESFPDLSEAMTGRSGEDMDTLSHQIFEESSKGAESFEVFGVKFPAEQVTWWGIILLIGIQLYFVMYLRRLSDNINPDDPGWDVPWMAMDSSLLARAMLWVSMVALPTTAAVLVMRQATRQAYFAWMKVAPWRNIARFLIAYDKTHLLWILVGCCASAYLSVLSWKYRPKASEPVAPPQLFE